MVRNLLLKIFLKIHKFYMFPYKLNDFASNKSHKFHYKIIKIIIIKVVLYDKFYNITLGFIQPKSNANEIAKD